MLDFVGVGDLHLDGKLRKYLPDLNSLILDEVRRVRTYAKREGVKLLVFYGDMCEYPHMSDEAKRLLLAFLMEDQDFMYIFILGNHDKENSETHSMQLFSDMCAFGLLPHVRVIEKPTTMFKKSDTPLRLLPWPSLDTRSDCLNVIHEEVKGAMWDHGRPVGSGHEVKDDCVAGHLHTPHRVGSVHFSGTLYQTSFGEKPKKFFHHVTWRSADEKKVIRKIPHQAAFQLINLVVTDYDDLQKIENNPMKLYKVFVQADVTLDADTFADKPNVVKTNSFKTKTELVALMEEEIKLDEEFGMENVLRLDTNLKDWLDGQTNVEQSLRERAYSKFEELYSANVNKPTKKDRP